MREKIAEKLTGYLRQRPSEFFRRTELAVLMKETAAAFGIRGRDVFFAKDPLAVYAQFTKEAAQLPGTDPEKLYERMYRLGQRIRRISGLQKPEDLLELLYLLYRGINISLKGNTEEGFHFTECYFSNVYTPEECSLMSALDSGIIAGLLGEGKLVFTRRITEGCSSCEACFARRVS